MKHAWNSMALLAAFACANGAELQARGGGFGGGGGRGFSGGGGFSGGYRGGSVGGGYGGAHYGGGSYTGPRGGSIEAGGAAGAYRGPLGGVHAGAVGGAEVTGPGGRSVTTGGAGHVGVGPAGGFNAGATRATGISGPGGAAAIGHHGGVAVGPYGAAGVRTGTAAFGTRGTYYRSTTAIRTQGNFVRTSVAGYGCFRPGWYARYPGAWFAAGWGASAVWNACTWPSMVTYCGYPADPIYYDYGANVVYQDDGVYFDGTRAYSTEQYAQQATETADAGRTAQVTKDENWMPLGVFAMVQGDEKVSNNIFQLAVDKNGIIRGNYYDSVTDTTSVVYGSVDKKLQRAAWTVGDRKTPVYEVGIANLTKDETTMMVHYGDRSQQFTLVRVDDPDQKKE